MAVSEQDYFISRHQGGDDVLLVYVDLHSDASSSDVDEFYELAISAGLEIHDMLLSRRSSPDPKYFVGKGKCDEIQSAVQFYNASAVIFNHNLTPAQGRNLENTLCVRVLDRTELILDIFAQRARTHEGKCQVELAQLQHLRSRLVRGWSHLERQKGGIGLRGPGETQLETDRRLVDTRIKNIKKRLHKVMKQRDQGRQSRRKRGLPTVSLVGYTNAGKSTLFNYLTQESVMAESILFATLDPTLRQIDLPVVGKIVLADTVGFIRDLPHDLVAAFRATLEETQLADVLLHVVDVNQDEMDDTIAAVLSVLEQVGASDIPSLMVFNKIDLMGDASPRIVKDESGTPVAVWVSSKTGQGIDLLKTAISAIIADDYIECDITLSPTEGRLRGELYNIGAIREEKSTEEGGAILSLSITQADYQRLLKGREL